MSTKLQVLVIDDDAVVGRSFDRVLSEKGYEVSTALSGEEALDTIENTEFDVVFTDIKMPGMDGLEVTERIKARCPWTPVVVITGYGTVENEARASVLGVSGFVNKPLTPEIIESVTLKALAEPEEAEIVAESEVDAEVKTVEDADVLKKTGACSPKTLACSSRRLSSHWHTSSRCRLSASTCSRNWATRPIQKSIRPRDGRQGPTRPGPVTNRSPGQRSRRHTNEEI